ncbi:MAG TPA: O-antigen ligase family protein, partial [Candidatus Dormibacteraeota bacterium]|nr:O-antigen ligase family protein [Candidatus Dormibacteraeota bacterium]
MSPQIILYGCYAVVGWVLRKDMQWRKAGSWALLIPGIWLAIQGSRPISYWFGGQIGESSLDANPINTLIFTGLLLAALIILSRRSINWALFIRHNKMLCLIYFYLALSALWSEMPMISFKRVIKDFGCVLMALVYLTEPNPAETVRTIFVRVSYLLFPLSVVFIKFFPDIGRQFSHAGEAMFTGITLQKNSLGELVFVFGVMIVWDLVEISKQEPRPGKKFQMGLRVLLFLIGFWLLRMCDSQTSLLCLTIGLAILWGSAKVVKMRQGRKVLIACIVFVICLAALDQTIGLKDMIIRAMGRNPTLTGRTDIWKLVLRQNTDPILGSGFYTFWDSSKGQAVMDAFMKINEAHNGYLEMYVDGGIVGDILLCMLLVAGGRRAIDGLFAGALGKVGLIFWVLPIIYN